eukprot:276443-Pleurochrysis_carterae.AAC.7
MVERRGDARDTNESHRAARGKTQEWHEGELRSRTGVDELHRFDGDGGAEGCDGKQQSMAQSSRRRERRCDGRSGFVAGRVERVLRAQGESELGPQRLKFGAFRRRNSCSTRSSS